MGFPQAEHILEDDRHDIRSLYKPQQRNSKNFTHDEAKLVAAEVDDGTALLPVAPDSED
jgi:hypothetical protein